MNLIDYQNQSFLEEYEELSCNRNPSLDNLLRKSLVYYPDRYTNRLIIKG